MGRAPSVGSYLTFLPTERYYAVSVFFFPIFELAKWLLLGAVIPLALRLAGRPSHFDQSLNIADVGALIIEPVVRVWDWIALAMGRHADATFIGISHLIIADPWGIALMVIAYKKIFGLPAWLIVCLSLLVHILFVPLAVLFVRA